MTRHRLITFGGLALLAGFALGSALAQQAPPAAPAGPVPYFVGNPLGMPINPAADGVFTLPGPFTYDLRFNEPVDPASVQADDLALAGLPGAVVLDATVLPGGTTIRFTIGGVEAEGTLEASLAAGAFTDTHGNPGAAFAASHVVDFGTTAYPAPLAPVAPLGSLST